MRQSILDMCKMSNQFRVQIEQLGIVIQEKQLQTFEAYYRTLIDWNQRMNLTAITNQTEVYIKHFYDSLTLANHVDISSIQSLADIGSGAGFPSIPLKIMFPHLNVTIIDSLKKRIHFLESLVEILSLKDVQCVHGRAEDTARDSRYRDSFHLVTARAVARLPVLNEFCLPFTKENGIFIAMKGSDYVHEVEEAQKSFKLLNAKVENIHVFTLPEENGQRANIVIRKIGPTPKMYPRKAGTPLKQPLI
jgi:16S rRNA (guanine527-N7)-methyltransferase